MTCLRLGGRALLAMYSCHLLAVLFEPTLALTPSLAHWQGELHELAAPCRDAESLLSLRARPSVFNRRTRLRRRLVDHHVSARTRCIGQRAKGNDRSGERPTSRWRRLFSRVPKPMKKLIAVMCIGLALSLYWNHHRRPRPDVAYTTLLAA
eukprot:4946166-Amphidinium_carterae.1